MKKLLVILISIGLASGASAQKGFHRGGHYVRGPRVIVGVRGGFGPYYPYYGGLSPFGYPYGMGYRYGYSPRPSRLELQIEDIKVDYADRIQSVKMDPALKGRARRQTIRQLKTDRDRAVIDAKRNYYYNRSSAGTAPSDSGSENSNNNNSNPNQ